MATVAMEEYELMKDSKYRMYVAAVDKALKNFEYTSEWADLISALGKLNKVLLGYTKFPVIPRRIKISKRLAQCMHPALPSGVHLKALETYDIIFKCMGTNRLSYELFIYSAGLFPLLGHAAMTIRPMLLQLYETHFVPLRERLRPALSGFLSGVLPGLETGSDHFDRTNDLLEAVCDGVGPAWFYTCIWQCVRSNSPIRLPAISYVLTHYSRKLSMEDQLYLMGNDIDVMVSGLCAAVQDSSVLVQRSALDLLMVCFPMHNTQLLYADMVRLVTAGLSTILRRDMSLNRRLYSWLLGAEINVTILHSEHPLIKRISELLESSNHTEAYFELYSYDILAEAIRVTLTQSSVETSIDIKPYRLLTSLFDKPQIGPVILDNILYDVFRALYLTTIHQQKLKNNSGRCVSFNGDITSLKADTNHVNKQFLNNNCQELIKNANLLFNTLEPYYIWLYVTKLYEDAITAIIEKKKVCRDRCQINEIGSGAPNLLEACILTEFLLDIIHIETYADGTSEILPNLFVKIVTVASANLTILNKHEITQTLELCAKVLTKIQPVTMKNVPKTEIEINLTEQTENGDSTQTDFVQNDTFQSDLDRSFNEMDLKFGLEKSKSDSKINENLSKNELTVDDVSRERSNSNQMLKKQRSPKIDKKNKNNKKSKSISKLYELKKDETNNDSTSSGNVSPEKPPPTIEISESATLTESTLKIENKHLVKCLQFYKSFYVEFLQIKIAPGVKMAEHFAKLVLDKDERTRNLESLLHKCLNAAECLDFVDQESEHCGSDNVRTSGGKLGKTCEYDKAMSLASNILLEFSTFPSLLDEDGCENSKEMPDWLRALIVCACGSHNSTKDVQIIAMNTLLELFSLAKSQHLQARQSGHSNSNVVVMGILEYTHVYYIEDSTYIIEILSQILWDFLGVLHNQDQLMTCVSLLYQIHNIFDTKYFVEDVIANYLINENLNVDFFKRFSLLWHLGRSLDSKMSSNQPNSRNFDRSLLKILDNLQNDSDCNLKLLAETFLTHTLLRNDIARLVSPIFAILLAPTTARISIRHINIQNADLQRDMLAHDAHRLEDAKFKKIYAISSVNGNVMYHVADEASTKPYKRKSFLFSKVGKKSTMGGGAINMTTSLTENSSVVTKKNKDFKNVEASPKMDANAKNNVKLFINPLSSKEIYPDGLTGSYTKLNNELPCDQPSSEKSSSESLSDLTQTSSDSLNKNFQYLNAFPQDRDSGFESQNNSLLLRKSTNEESCSNRHSLDSGLEGIKKRAFFEHLDSVSDGITDKKSEAINVFSKSHSFDEKNDHQKLDDIENSLVHSWSYCLSDSERLNCELEMSTAAEEFFKGSDRAIISELLNEILDNVCGVETTNAKQIPGSILKQTGKNFTVYPMHYHMCLYYNVFDSDLILYSLETLRNSILSNPHLFVQCLATTGLKNLKNNDILYLLARHRKSLLGGGFYGEINQEHVNFYRGYMFLDTVISICLNYSRTFFPNLDNRRLTHEEICKNLKIQLASLEVLDITIKSIINIVKENSKGFASYIADMLVKCKLQKILLHCLLTSVRNFDEDMTFAEEILMFNNFQLYNLNKKVCEHVEAFQIQLLRLIQSLIILEYHVFPKQEATNAQQQASLPSLTGEHLTYTPTILIPEQQMFLSAIMSALRHQNMKCLHENWCNMVTSCLPYFGQNLKQIALSVVHQICNNIEKMADSYKSRELGGELCSDYAVTQLNSLTILCHYCLLDSSQSAPQNINPNTPSTSSAPISNPGEILNNLMSVFFAPTVGDINQTNKQNCNYYQNARKTILSHMPRIIISVAKLWQTIVNIENEFNGVFGNSKIVKQQLLEFLSPISIYHGASFLAAIAIAWYERRNPFTNVKTVLPEPNASQSNLVYLISAIRVIPLDNLVQTVTAVIKNPPPTEGLSSDVCLDVSVLELFYCYMRNASATQLSEAWGSLLTLVREGCALGPPAQFLLAAILHELMIKCCPLEERKDQKDLQDVTAKLIECVAQVCGSCLEQTTWLRRNFAVKEQEDGTGGGMVNGTANSEVLSTSNHSVHAQLVLSEILAPILDICFGSSEKDKVNTILSSLMYNIVPYLRTHTSRNMPSFHACSKLLASLSSYQYTRKAWKKDVFDLLLDNVLFQMDYSCLKYWKVIVDNLMTHDNTTFRDLMNRVSITQSGSLSLFSSKEQEYEQKAQLLKRLAFVIFCSETDQYSKYMPDIQEQLNANLRMNAPGIQAQVFLCFRVLLIRMSPMHVTSLWPIVISEMLQVFLQIEQELSTDTEEFSSHIKLLSALDASWATNSNNGLHALGHPHYMRLQLSTAKLLDLALLLPATALPQFQMYRWAFVGDDLIHASPQSSTQDAPTFTPHVSRIANLMDQKFTDTQIETLPTKQNELLLNMTSINQLKDLHSFFKTLSLCSNRHRTECSSAFSNDHNLQDKQTDKKFNAILEKIDKVIEMDFLEKISR